MNFESCLPANLARLAAHLRILGRRHSCSLAMFGHENTFQIAPTTLPYYASPSCPRKMPLSSSLRCILCPSISLSISIFCSPLSFTHCLVLAPCLPYNALPSGLSNHSASSTPSPPSLHQVRRDLLRELQDLGGLDEYRASVEEKLRASLIKQFQVHLSDLNMPMTKSCFFSTLHRREFPRAFSVRCVRNPESQQARLMSGSSICHTLPPGGKIVHAIGMRRWIAEVWSLHHRTVNTYAHDYDDGSACGYRAVAEYANNGCGIAEGASEGVNWRCAGCCVGGAS
jgi:hypothetical protein